MTEIIQYAPVVIPTLNRYEHFKICLESLEKCTWADKTDVYVGLDYPPSEKYVEGWKKIDVYLAEKEKKHGFNNLFVRRRDHNCGVGSPNSNGNLLYNEVKETADRYIFTEDDNEFSPCFLDYINKGLEKYKDYPNVYAICGYNYPIDMSGYNYNYYFSHEFSGWGYGGWFEKKEAASKLIYTPTYLLDFFKNHSLSIFLRDEMRLISFIRIVGRGYLGDYYITIYLYSHDIFCVFPKTSLVRNWGQDGSGLHSIRMDTNSAKLYTEQPIDDKYKFEFRNDIKLAVSPITKKNLLKFRRTHFKTKIKNLFQFFLLRLFMKLQ